MDLFRLRTEEEIKNMISEFWEDTEYLVKLRILLKAYPGYSITKLEERGISKMWKSLSLEKKKDIYNNQYRYQFTHWLMEVSKVKIRPEVALPGGIGDKLTFRWLILPGEKTRKVVFKYAENEQERARWGNK